MLHFLLSWALIIFSIYIIFECIDALAGMPKGVEHLCHKLKYGFIGSISLINFLAGWLGSATIYAGLITFTFFLVVWPRMAFRFHRWTQHPWELK